MFRKLIITLCLAFAFVSGAAVQAKFGFLGAALVVIGIRDRLADVSLVPYAPAAPTNFIKPTPIAAIEPREVDCAIIPQGRTIGLLVAGQSNADNVAPLFEPQNDTGIFVAYQGRCYRGFDPLPGAPSDGASIWTALARKMIDARMADTVVIAPAVVGGTTIELFARGGVFHPMLTTAAKGIGTLGIPSIFLWQHGEADASRGTTAEYYRTNFDSMVAGLRAIGFVGPVLAAKAGRCGGFYSPSIRSVQSGGPDTDVLAKPYRDDNCHFNSAGREAAAALWMDAIRAAGFREVAP